jgi:hypothetical protein
MASFLEKINKARKIEIKTNTVLPSFVGAYQQ